MLRHYPVILHTEDGVSCGVTVPDFPGCFTSGETLEEALSNVQGAVEAYLLIPGGRRHLPPIGRHYVNMLIEQVPASFKYCSAFIISTPSISSSSGIFIISSVILQA